MRIGVDVRKIKDTGIGRHIDNLVKNLLLVDKSHHYVLFFAPGEEKEFYYPENRVTKVVEKAGKYSVWEHFSLPAKATEHKIDLFHSPHYTLPLRTKCRSVVTVHDLIHLQDDSLRCHRKAYAQWMIKKAVKKAGKVIVVSETTKKELMQRMNTPADKIRVVLNGGGDFRKTADGELDEVLAKMNLSSGYFLFVGSDRPHKNLKAVANTMKLMGEVARFVIVGRVDDKSLFDEVAGDVRFLNRLEKGEMEALYTGATALLFPSYLEGFGLPPLEAMACQSVVVASNRSSIPEVTGDAAILVDPDDYPAMAEALKKISLDQGFRKELVDKGRERIKQFSWEKAARETLRVYEEVMV